jgi:hypothetical protein
MNIKISKRSHANSQELVDPAELQAAELLDQALSATHLKVTMTALQADFGVEAADLAGMVGKLRRPIEPAVPAEAFMANLEARVEAAFEARPVAAPEAMSLGDMGLRWRGWSMAGAFATALGLAAFFLLSGLDPDNKLVPPTAVAATNTATVPTPEALATFEPVGIGAATQEIASDQTIRAVVTQDSALASRISSVDRDGSEGPGSAMALWRSKAEMTERGSTQRAPHVGFGAFGIDLHARQPSGHHGALAHLQPDLDLGFSRHNHAKPQRTLDANDAQEARGLVPHGTASSPALHPEMWTVDQEISSKVNLNSKASWLSAT